MAPKKALRISLAVIALLAAACGGDDGGAATEIDVSMEESFLFAPTEWTIAADEEITVNLENTDTTPHDFVILQSGVTVESESDLPENEDELLADFVYWEKWVPRRGFKTGTFTAPAAGTYQIVCTIGVHLDKGMTGTLIVEG